MARVELVAGQGCYEGVLPDGRHVTVVPLLLGRARLTVGHGRMIWDQGW